MNTTEQNIQKARLLLEQGRYRDAEKELGQALGQDPDNDQALGLLARVKMDTGAITEAIEILGRALAQNPEEDYFIYLRAFAHYKLNMHLSAIQDLDEALAMNPYNPGYFSLYAFVLIAEKRYTEALEKANEGLAVDAEDIGCLNARSRALNKLNRVDDAVATMKDSLAVDPDNDWTHASIGWNFLEKGQHKQAAHHFQEALRINPANYTAKDGMKEALKSRIAPYRWFLRYGIWLSDRGRGARIAMSVGLYFCFRLAAFAATKLPSPFNYLAYMLVALYLLAVLCSWLITPIANFFLSFHPQGKYALTTTEKITSKSVIAALLLGLACFVISLAFQHNEQVQTQLFIAAIIAASLALPLGLIQYPLQKNGTPKKVWAMAAISGLGILATAGLFTFYEAGIALAVIYAIALVLTTWLTAFR